MNKDLIEMKLDAMIKTLEKAITVNLESSLDKEKGYPWATGYSRSAMMQIVNEIADVKRILNA